MCDHIEYDANNEIPSSTGVNKRSNNAGHNSGGARDRNNNAVLN